MAGCQKPISYSLHLSGIVTAEVVDAQTKAPLVKGGCLGTAEAGGFPRLAGFHMGLCFRKVPAVNPSVKNQRFLTAPFHKGALRRAAADNFAPGWSVIVTSLTRPVSLLRCSRCIDQSPPCQRGVPRQRRGGGIPQAPPGYFLPNHSSLFTKKPSPFHMGSYFGKVPAVESLSHG